jgi:rod shape-determining protein MreC
MVLWPRTDRPGRARFTLLLLVVGSGTALTLDYRGSAAVDDLRRGAVTAFAPLRDAGAWVARPLADAWNGAVDHAALADENERLRARVDALDGQQAAADAALRQLDELAALDAVSQWTDLPTVVARVLGGSLSNFEHAVELDKGSDDGLAVGMPVVTGAGLVGRIVSVTGDRSAVQLLTDPAWRFGVRLAASGEVGVARGNGAGEPLSVDEGVELGVAVHRAEAVTTSGYGDSIFPPEIPVGRVGDLGVAPDGMSQVVAVHPLADLDDLSTVRVVRWTTEP